MRRQAAAQNGQRTAENGRSTARSVSGRETRGQSGCIWNRVRIFMAGSSYGSSTHPLGGVYVTPPDTHP
jgi:hypothetical protein